MKGMLVAALGAALLGGCASVTNAGALVDVAVVNRTTGARIPVHRHEGKLYVAGTPGEKYAVYVANRSPGRVLTVVSVDGINVVTGETAAAEQNGYVLGPRQSFEINGWRKNMSEIAAFYFTRLPDSYAARTDRPENVGVIGVAVFREWQPPRPASVPQPLARDAAREAESAAADAPAAAAGAPAAPSQAARAESAENRALRRQERIGTGHGERETSHVVYTDFRRATDRPAEIVTIQYDTYVNLVARGVIRSAPATADPNPFPGGRFVPDPRG